MIKLFGVGNILLCDDGIGVRVLEEILPKLQNISCDIEGIIGETNYLFCLDCIKENDFVIIIDSTYLDIAPGSISYFPFSECKRFITQSQFAHQVTLLQGLLQEMPEVPGCLIGIEISKIDFSLELSDELQVKFKSICKEVLQVLEKVVKTYA